MSCRHMKREMPAVICNESNNCICSLPTLIILILIVLQFAKRNKKHDYDDDDCDYEEGSRRRYDKDDYDEDDCYDGKQVDNGLLFIIALFFLSCAGCGKGFR